MSGQQDLPGYSSTQKTEALGLLAVQAYLVRHGFKVTEVTGRFDDGLDLLVSPHDEANVLPVFGVVLTEPEADPPRGGWCDAQTAHPGARSIPTPHPFPDGLAPALCKWVYDAKKAA